MAPFIRIRKHLARYILALMAFFMFQYGCKDLHEQDKYQRPDWLAGKLYTQLTQQKELSTFAQALELTGYDTILDLSGSFTVFAPSNEAFERFFSENPRYGDSLSGVPMNELLDIVKFHIIQNAWSKKQLSMLDIYGWIDPSDPESEPRAYKRQTLLKEPDRKYWVKTQKEKNTIVDSSEANGYKTVYTRSRKYAPIFYDEMFDVFDLTPGDYEFYFERPFESGNIFYAGARLGDEEIFAENGFIYVIDRVVKPFLNGRQILERELPGETYSVFLELINLFPRFEFNPEETYSQLAARQGRLYDSLFDLSFPELPFDVHEELTGPSVTVSDYTYMYHNALFIPTDLGFQRFLDEVVTINSGYPHWPDFESMPLEIKQIIINTHFANSPVYRSDIVKGFENADKSVIDIDESMIIRKEYGSNCTFIGLNNAVVPRAFSSISGPVYLRPEYRTYMYALERSKIRSAISDQEADYCFFALPNSALSNDSSLLMEWVDKDLNMYRFRAYDRGEETMVNISRRELSKLILNHVGISQPDGSANKEFIENLAGNYIIWDNVSGTVSGAIPSTYGYRGDSIVQAEPVLFEEPVDNGKAYSINTWLRNVRTGMFGTLSGYSKFTSLLQKAGLYSPQLYEYTLLTDGEFYTIFAPTDQALEDYGADTMPVDELKKFLRHHFVKRHLIFTDGKKPSQEYETLRVDESSTPYSTYYSTVNIETGPDLLEILDAEGNPYITIPETPGKTNLMVGKDTDLSTASDLDYITIAVVHEIDTVLVNQ